MSKCVVGIELVSFSFDDAVHDYFVSTEYFLSEPQPTISDAIKEAMEKSLERYAELQRISRNYATDDAGITFYRRLITTSEIELLRSIASAEFPCTLQWTSEGIE